MTQSETPIFDALFLERAINDQEGRDLVHAIHVRKGYLPPAPAEAPRLTDPEGDPGSPWRAIGFLGLFR